VTLNASHRRVHDGTARSECLDEEPTESAARACNQRDVLWHWYASWSPDVIDLVADWIHKRKRQQVSITSFRAGRDASLPIVCLGLIRSSGQAP
jgi:hypothetical protein